jgi:hypothetical protein
VTIIWQSEYTPFVEKGIPEINDLNVYLTFRRHGIATTLIDKAERCIFERLPVVGIGVGVYTDYGSTRRMYVLRGYVSDGLGLAYKRQPVRPGQEVPISDDLNFILLRKM